MNTYYLLAYLVLCLIWMCSALHSSTSNRLWDKTRSRILARVFTWGGFLILSIGYSTEMGVWVIPASLSLNLSLLMLVESSLGGRPYHSGATLGDRSNLIP